ncbi:MAG TPA: hypothetical protein VMZ91_11675 [Candidatus Paceibacterota bacterium]|nr:hypothetical protein [Candidatus Paceibacterota bacterium]
MFCEEKNIENFDQFKLLRINLNYFDQSKDLSINLNSNKIYSNQLNYNFKKIQLKRYLKLKNTKKRMFVQNQILIYLHSKGMFCSEMVYKGERLNQKLKTLLDDAIIRAKENKRRTVQEKDL